MHLKRSGGGMQESLPSCTPSVSPTWTPPRPTPPHPRPAAARVRQKRARLQRRSRRCVPAWLQRGRAYIAASRRAAQSALPALRFSESRDLILNKLA